MCRLTKGWADLPVPGARREDDGSDECSLWLRNMEGQKRRLVHEWVEREPAIFTAGAKQSDGTLIMLFVWGENANKCMNTLVG